MAFHQYNTFVYNASQYNADAFFLVQSCAETISSSDTMGGKAAIKVVADTMTLTDSTVAKNVSRSLGESVQLLDAVTKSITNKGLSETLRVNDWVEVKRTKSSQSWS